MKRAKTDSATQKIMILLTLMVFALTCALVLGATKSSAQAQNYQPGSVDDPLVTQSYVDKRISEALLTLSGTGIDSELLLMQLEFLLSEKLSEGALTFQPVLVQAGQSIIGKEGTELILRTGQGVAVAEFDTIINVTTGVDVQHGAPIAKNNLLIIPRDDGRGVLVTVTAWFMVKGAYTIN